MKLKPVIKYEVGDKYYRIHEVWSTDDCTITWKIFPLDSDVYVCVGYDHWWDGHSSERNMVPSPIVVNERTGEKCDSYFALVSDMEAMNAV